MKKLTTRQVLKTVNNYVIFFLTVGFAVSCCMMLFLTVLSRSMGIAFDASNPEILRNAQFLRDWVEQSTGIKLLTTPNDQKAAIRLVIGMNADSKTKKSKKSEEPIELSEQQQEAYKIKVGAEGIAIYAHNPIGFYRAAQTLRKALPIVNEREGRD